MPVSYTHLDVYKRQVLIGLGAIVGALLVILLAYAAYVFLSMDRIEDDLPLDVAQNAAETVETGREYTLLTWNLGLDVYKRQVIRRVRFIGGCTGNTQGLSRLVEGMRVDEVIHRLKGIQCRAGTSCPDQLARAIERMRANA